MKKTLERHNRILELLKEQGQITIQELLDQFKVSEVTLRKDLNSLQEQNKLIRNYGGAVLINQTNDLNNKNHPYIYNSNKLAIANKAASLIKDQYRIIIDSGKTTAALIDMLDQFEDLVVMSNCLDIAKRLLELNNPPTLLMTGGTWDRRSKSFQGQLAERALKHYQFDLLFIGADGVDLERGTTTFNELTGLSQVMAQASDKVVLMVESCKIGRKMHNLELLWQNIDILITDNAIDPNVILIIEQQGVKVIVA